MFGTVPAARPARTPLAETLKEGGRAGTASASQRRVQCSLVVAEIALVLSIGAALMIRSFAALEHERPRLRADPLSRRWTS